eukprot:TRINITY_DN16691_c0_g1_i1.p1 TRINITY_DN16691_c0_g1~~TRINITY_DN16691_c0_g1_i1.p1  ORF type:complete len:551 (+),score=267.67 TRINITY_DN16691_c0_g1_i1:49-1701(+)
MATVVRACVALLLAAALPAACGMEWSVASDLADLRRESWPSLLNGFRVRPNRGVGLYGKPCTPTDDGCASITVDLVVNTTQRGRYFKENMELVVLAYTRTSEGGLKEALKATDDRDSLCKGFAKTQDGTTLFETPAVEAMLDGGEVVLMRAPYTPGSNGDFFLSQAQLLEHTNLWITNVAMCNTESLHAQSLNVTDRPTGNIKFMSSTGHLDVGRYSLMKFFLGNFICLTVLTVAWLLYGLYKRSAFGGVHVGLTVMIMITAVENLIRYFEFRQWNTTGEIRTFELYFVMLFEAFRKVAWCFLLCLLVNGYRSIHATLRESNIQLILMITAAYFFINCMSLLHDPRDEETKQSHFIEAGQNAADLLIYVYVFTVLYKTIEVLEAQSQHTKKKLFVKLYTVLAGYIVGLLVVLVTVILIFTQLTRSGAESMWRYGWVIYAMFPLLFEVALLTLMVLWHPSEESVQLMYAIELNDDMDEAPGPERGGVVEKDDMFSGLDDQIAGIAPPEAEVPTLAQAPQQEEGHVTSAGGANPLASVTVDAPNLQQKEEQS